jgi:cell shape-determining protein MreD
MKKMLLTILIMGLNYAFVVTLAWGWVLGLHFDLWKCALVGVISVVTGVTATGLIRALTKEKL